MLTALGDVMWRTELGGPLPGGPHPDGTVDDGGIGRTGIGREVAKRQQGTPLEFAASRTWREVRGDMESRTRQYLERVVRAQPDAMPDGLSDDALDALDYVVYELASTWLARDLHGVASDLGAKLVAADDATELVAAYEETASPMPATPADFMRSLDLLVMLLPDDFLARLTAPFTIPSSRA